MISFTAALFRGGFFQPTFDLKNVVQASDCDLWSLHPRRFDFSRNSVRQLGAVLSYPSGKISREQYLCFRLFKFPNHFLP